MGGEGALDANRWRASNSFFLLKPDWTRAGKQIKLSAAWHVSISPKQSTTSGRNPARRVHCAKARPEKPAMSTVSANYETNERANSKACRKSKN